MDVIKEEIICRMFVTFGTSLYRASGDQFLKVFGITCHKFDDRP
jgi:hypothetical protein